MSEQSEEEIQLCFSIRAYIEMGPPAPSAIPKEYDAVPPPGTMWQDAEESFSDEQIERSCGCTCRLPLTVYLGQNPDDIPWMSEEQVKRFKSCYRHGAIAYPYTHTKTPAPNGVRPMWANMTPGLRIIWVDGAKITVQDVSDETPNRPPVAPSPEVKHRKRVVWGLIPPRKIGFISSPEIEEQVQELMWRRWEELEAEQERNFEESSSEPREALEGDSKYPDPESQDPLEGDSKCPDPKTQDPLEGDSKCHDPESHDPLEGDSKCHDPESQDALVGGPGLDGVLEEDSQTALGVDPVSQLDRASEGDPKPHLDDELGELKEDLTLRVGEANGKLEANVMEEESTSCEDGREGELAREESGACSGEAEETHEVQNEGTREEESSKQQRGGHVGSSAHGQDTEQSGRQMGSEGAGEGDAPAETQATPGPQTVEGDALAETQAAPGPQAEEGAEDIDDQPECDNQLVDLQDQPSQPQVDGSQTNGETSMHVDNQEEELENIQEAEEDNNQAQQIENDTHHIHEEENDIQNNPEQGVENQENPAQNFEDDHRQGHREQQFLPGWRWAEFVDSEEEEYQRARSMAKAKKPASPAAAGLDDAKDKEGKKHKKHKKTKKAKKEKKEKKEEKETTEETGIYKFMANGRPSYICRWDGADDPDLIPTTSMEWVYTAEGLIYFYAVLMDVVAYKNLPYGMRSHYVVADYCMLRNGLDLQYAPKHIRSDYRCCLHAVWDNGLALEYVDDDAEVRKNRDIVRIACAENGLALQFAGIQFRRDIQIVWDAVTQDGRALQYAEEEMKADEEVVLQAVQQNGRALQFASEELRNNRELVLTAILQDGMAVQYASSHLQRDIDLLITAIRGCAFALRYAAPSLRNLDVLMPDVAWKNPLAAAGTSGTVCAIVDYSFCPNTSVFTLRLTVGLAGEEAEVEVGAEATMGEVGRTILEQKFQHEVTKYIHLVLPNEEWIRPMQVKELLREHLFEKPSE